MNTTLPKPIILDHSDWWRQLELTTLPPPLLATVRSLISATLHHTIPPQANDSLVAAAKEHLQGGIVLLSPESPQNKHFEVVVLVPTDEKHRMFFTLVPKYEGTEMKRLSEL